MENIYLIILLILGITAISDLVVGVSNDAVNFLNSAIGSKVAPVKWIFAVATLGIIIGTTFSNGMMEVARSGIFNPGAFYFSEIMIIFLAVMITDVLLLDTFNTLGLPTSTTVSIVFELLGAAVGVAMLKMIGSGDSGNMADYINSGKVLAIISGILLSVAIAFTVGSFIMYVVRIVFTFDFTKSLKYFGSIYGGLAITVITFFILIKGAKGSSILTDSTIEWIGSNSGKVLLYSFVGWTVIIQFMVWIFRANVFKIIVLFGTFALAMAFAGNDLVNFIGVPLAGIESYKAWLASNTEPALFPMGILAAKVKTPTIFLLLAGIVMTLALWFSKKARSVTQTELNLSKQDEGTESFGSSVIARSLVRKSVQASKVFEYILPGKIGGWLTKRFNKVSESKSMKESGASFDLVRASVNLLVSSALIAFGTSKKLPLSTTYVTFMVAMGSSLADGAWGRDSAVYRVTGVITVILGWFFTAFAAFTASLIIALVLTKTGFVGIAVLVILSVIMLVRSYALHKKIEGKKATAEKEYVLAEMRSDELIPATRIVLVSYLSQMSLFYEQAITALIKEDLKALRDLRRDFEDFDKDVKRRKDNVLRFIKNLVEEDVTAGPYYVQVIDYLRELAHSIKYLIDPVFNHVDNNHPALTTLQQKELRGLTLEIKDYLNFQMHIIRSGNYDEIEIANRMRVTLLENIETISVKQLERIKKGDSSTKTSLLYLNSLSETKNIVLQSINLLKAMRDFSGEIEK